MNQEWKPDGTLRGNPMSAEFLWPKAVPRTEVELPHPQDKVQVLIPARPVCTSPPGAEPTLRPAFSQRESSLSLSYLARPLLRASLPCSQSPLLLPARPLSAPLFPLSEPILPLLGSASPPHPGVLRVWIQVAATFPRHPLACRSSRVLGSYMLVLSPGPHWLCDPG